MAQDLSTVLWAVLAQKARHDQRVGPTRGPLDVTRDQRKEGKGRQREPREVATEAQDNQNEA
jgi:hypothetical protein